MREISIIGLGYIGLPTAAMFAYHGIKVRGVDVQKKICETINQGNIHIQEPHLAEVVKTVVEKGMLTADTEVKECDTFIIAVPTPITRDKRADLSYVKAAAQKIYPVLKKGNLVVLESTVPPGCTEEVLISILEKSGMDAKTDFFVAYCPERVLPGQILRELESNNRIIGGINQKSAEKAKELYSCFVKGDIYETNVGTAELCKLMENTYRDVNIALANETSRICERLGLNVWDVIRLANKHPRVNLHYPGPGVGGHCLAVDPWFIVEAAPELAGIIELSRKTNDSMPYHIYQKIKAIVPRGGKIIILGCTYKADVDDIRESPILEMVNLLDKEGEYTVEIVDPFLREYDKDLYEAAIDSDLLVLGVNHSLFKTIRFSELKMIMKGNAVLDTRNFFDREEVMKSGLTYYLLGSA